MLFFLFVFLTKIGVCTDVLEIWFWIANGLILSVYVGVICSHDMIVARYYCFMLFEGDGEGEGCVGTILEKCVQANCNAFRPPVITTMRILQSQSEWWLHQKHKTDRKKRS